MAQYVFTARTKEGKMQKGSLDAGSPGQVVDALQSRGLVVISVEEKPTASLEQLSSLNIGGVPLNDKVVFMRQIATMIGAGLPLTQSLEILTAQAQNKAFKTALTDVVNDVRSGVSLSAAFSKKEGIFDDITINLIKAGEESGELEAIFMRLADDMENKRTFRAKVQGAMIYPVIIILAMVVVVAVLLVAMVPQMSDLYEEFDAKLPLPTQMLMWASDIMIKFWWLIIAVVGIAVGAAISYRKSEAGRVATDELLLKIPIFGNLTKNVQTAEFARTLEMLMKSGIPIINALNIVSASLSNVLFIKAVEKAAQAVEKGVPLAKPIAESEQFPLIVGQMIAVGEETGKIDVILGKLNSYFTEEVNHTVNNLTSLMEPFILVLMAVVIGFIAVAIYLPIFQIGEAIG